MSTGMAVDWHAFELRPLAEAIRRDLRAEEAERMLWAFEHALQAARVDPCLLDHLLVACTCLIARSHETAPREILDQFFRRAAPDDVWRHRYRPLLS